MSNSEPLASVTPIRPDIDTAIGQDITESKIADSARTQGRALVGMGIIHFALPKPVESIVPPQLPGSARFYNFASGIWELATGALLLNRGTRKAGGYSAALLYLAVWPGNFYHAYKELVAKDTRKRGTKAVLAGAYHIPRLFAQIALIRSALRIAANSD